MKVFFKNSNPSESSRNDIENQSFWEQRCQFCQPSVVDQLSGKKDKEKKNWWSYGEGGIKKHHFVWFLVASCK